jgi:hypothetical protein
MEGDMRIAVYTVEGDVLEPREIGQMLDEMTERGVIGETGAQDYHYFQDPHLAVRDGLAAALAWGEVLVLPRMEGRATVDPFLDFLAKSGKPLVIPQVGTYPHGEPLSKRGLAEIRAWGRAQASKKIRDGMGPTTGGDRGYRPPHENTVKARKAKMAAAQEAHEERGGDVLEAYASAGTYSGAARELNQKKVPTPTGNGRWHPEMVKRTMKRIGAL